MNEFIEKLIARLKKEVEYANRFVDEIHIGAYMAYNKSLKITNELAEEYNGGWIPCENELPKETGYYLVTYKKNENLLVGYWLFNGVDFNQTEEVEVLYWQPLPKPYNPKGE